MRAEDLHGATRAMGAHCARLYSTELDKAFHHIARVHAQCNKMYTFYSVPLVLPGEPCFQHADCLAYLKSQLRDNGYQVRVHKDGRTLFISWDKLQERPLPTGPNQHAEAAGRRAGAPSKGAEDEAEELVIMFNPDDPLSQLNLRAQLMAANPKYDHITKAGGRR
jgi:hypothetical protein